MRRRPFKLLAIAVGLALAPRLIAHTRVWFDLDARAASFGLRVEQVIVAPEYVPLVLGSLGGRRLGKLAGRFLRRPAWWRHDEHVHVDFALVAAR